MAYDLNPVNPAAQASIPPPDDIDLDAWIVPPPRDVVPEPPADVPDARKPRKGKARAKAKVRVVANGATGSPTHLQAAAVPEAPEAEETPQERARREQARAERLERQREDPYYIAVDTPARSPATDIDAIPIVRLDDLPPMHISPEVPAPVPRAVPSLLRASAQHVPTDTFSIDREGEMPAIAIASRPASLPSSRKPSRPASALSIAQPSPSRPFPEYVVEDDVPRASSTPEPIKVTRAKKSGTGKKKKPAKVASNTNGGTSPPVAA